MCYQGNFRQITHIAATNERTNGQFQIGVDTWKGTLLKDGLIEDGEEEAYRYMADVAELSNTEAEYFGLNMERYREATGEDTDDSTAPSSTGGDYSPSHPWDAPGMSASDFI